ncbi:MAG: hypothetical protein CMJ19_17720 [Phycisphaeraceae bacterium]|nr:hypothetical protein [Phycisphaeraceae bacterium]
MIINTIPAKAIHLDNQVKGCFLGKSIGGTLGMPYEGHEGFLDLDFYNPVPKKPLPNDDLDLQIIWLRCLQEHGLSLDNQKLGQAWLRHMDVHPDEYGVALWNLKKGIKPPLSGLHNNYFTDGMGAAIRSEIWACLFPGQPLTAAYYAYHDASVDHWGEGVLAEMFMAAFESHLFISRDLRISLDYALDLLPQTSRLRHAFEDVIACYDKGDDYQDTRQMIRSRWGSHNFTDCVMNLSFVIIGLLYGEGHFGRTLLCAVNCGEDADCTGATAGGIMGILLGDTGIPERWKSPVGETIVMGEYDGIVAPADVNEMTAELAQLRNEWAGSQLPEIQTPFTLPTLEDFSEKLPWKVNGQPVIFDGIHLQPGMHVKSLDTHVILEAHVRFPISGDIQAMVCSRGLFHFEFDGRKMGVKGDLANPVPSFHRIRGGRGFNLRVVADRSYPIKIALWPTVPTPDFYISFGDMDNRHLDVHYLDVNEGE